MFQQIREFWSLGVEGGCSRDFNWRKDDGWIYGTGNDENCDRIFNYSYDEQGLMVQIDQ